MCVYRAHAVSSGEALNSLPRCGVVHVYSFYQHIRARLHATFFFLLNNSLDLTDNPNDMPWDTCKQVQPLPQAVTWETHLNLAHWKLNLWDKVGISTINYVFSLSGHTLFYLFFLSFYPSLFYLINCIYLLHSFSHPLSAFSTSCPSHSHWWIGLDV